MNGNETEIIVKSEEEISRCHESLQVQSSIKAAESYLISEAGYTGLYIAHFDGGVTGDAVSQIGTESDLVTPFGVERILVEEI